MYIDLGRNEETGLPRATLEDKWIGLRLGCAGVVSRSAIMEELQCEHMCKRGDTEGQAARSRQDGTAAR